MSLLFDVIADLPAGIAVMPPVFIWDLGERPNSVSATGNVNINNAQLCSTAIGTNQNTFM